jgi:curved DNA-binding protein CbpA
MPTNDDYYEILGVDSQATEEQVRAAFRRLARDYHPDRYQGSGREVAEARFQRVTEAYNTLSDATARARYDQSRIGSVREKAEDPRELARALLARAVNLTKAGDNAQAEEYFRQAVAHDEGWAKAHHQYGLFLGRVEGRTGEALRHLDRAAKLDSLDVKVLLDAARMFARAGMASRALRLVRSARELAPGDPAVEDLWARFQQGASKG